MRVMSAQRVSRTTDIGNSALTRKLANVAMIAPYMPSVGIRAKFNPMFKPAAMQFPIMYTVPFDDRTIKAEVSSPVPNTIMVGSKQAKAGAASLNRSE